jgi:SAM-dependent methyltransferase
VTQAALSGPDALCADYERRAAASRGKAGRRAQGLFYTPPQIAALVVSLAVEHGPKLGARPRVLDACAGAGAFLLAAARALPEAQLCGTDLDGDALAVAAEALGLLGRRAQLETLDALEHAPRGGAVDLVVGNPPYGHAKPGAREGLLARFPALRGAEIDLYAAFLLRSLELLRPGGCAALLVPDTWMTNARAAPLRAEILARADLRAVADLGKPFAAAKDTRVQAVVLVRREDGAPRSARKVHAARLVEGRLVSLAPIGQEELVRRNAAGWQPYRTEGERRLCAALEAASVPLSEACAVGYGLRTGRNALHVGRGTGPAGAIPLCGGEDVVPFGLRLRPKHLASPTGGLLRLAARQQGTPRVAVQRIRTNAAAPWARWLEAAEVPAGMVCLDSITTLFAPPGAPALLPGLVGLCGSVAWNRWHRLRTTDVNVKPASLRELPLPRALLDPARQEAFAKLVRRREAEVAIEVRTPPLSRKQADLAPAPRSERALDREVYALFGLEPREVEEAERGFWGTRFEAEFDRLKANVARVAQ